LRLAGVLGARARLAARSLLPPRRGVAGAARALAGLALGLVLAGFIGFGLAAMFEALSAEGASAAEAARGLSLALSIALVAMLVFDLHESVATMVSDPDLELLRRAPVSPPALFGLKLLDAMPRTSALLMMIAAPAMVAFHLSYPLPLWGWPLALAMLLALWTVPLGLGAAFAMVLLARVPPRRARETLGVLSTLVIFLLWLANSFVLPRIALATEFTTLREMLGALPAFHRASPGYWAAGALGGLAGGDPGAAFGYALAVAAAAAASLGLAGWAAARHLETVQSRIAAGSGVRRSRTRPADADTIAALPEAPRGLVRSILVRDAKLVSRDWAILSDVLTAAILWMLLPLVAAPLYAAGADGRALVRIMLIALAVGLGYEVAARAFPIERRAAEWMRLAPVPAARWAAAKLAGAGMVSLVLMLLGLASLTAGFDLAAEEIVEAIAIALPALAVALAVGLWTGARHGNPEWTNPRAMLTLGGRLLAVVLRAAQAGAWIGWIAFLESGLVPAEAWAVFAAPLPVAAVVIAAAWWATVARLERAR